MGAAQSLFDECELPGPAEIPPDGGRFPGRKADARAGLGRAGPTPEPPAGKPGRAIQERDYQTDCVDRVFQEWMWHNATMVVMATGLGKTVVATKVCGRVLTGEVGPGGFLFLAHREELIQQAYETFRAAFPGRRVEVEQGTRYASPRADIVVASVASLSQPRRMALHPRDRFAAACIDECHHAPRRNASYTAILNHFQCLRLGLTATPDRADEAALGQTFDTVAFNYDILNGVKEGWLVPIRQVLVQCENLDFSRVRLGKNGDFREADLTEVMKQEEPLVAVVESAVKYSNWKGGRRSTLIFTAGTEQAVITANMLNRRNEQDGTGKAAAIHYKLDADVRRELIAMYKRQEIRYLVNYGILTEGFDDDETRVVVMGRLTKSRSLCAQIVGRATRPLREIMKALSEAPDAAARRAIIAASRKPGALVVDLCGNNHKLVVNATDVLGGRYADEVVSAVRDRMARNPAPCDVETELKREADRQAKLAKKKKEEEEIARRSGVIVTATLRSRIVDPFDVFDTVAGREPGYAAGRAMSPAQRNVLEKFGMRPGELDGLSMHRASRLIDICLERKRLGLCSYNTARILRRYGYEPNLTTAAARAVLDELKRNGWRRCDQ